MSSPRRTGTALVLAVILTALPLSGTLCAVLCAAAPSPASAQDTLGSGHHHGTGTTSHHEASPALQPQLAQLAGLPAHECANHATVGVAAEALRASRADKDFARVSLDLRPSTLAFVNVTLIRERAGYSPPSASSSPTRSPLVLRV